MVIMAGRLVADAGGDDVVVVEPSGVRDSGDGLVAVVAVISPMYVSAQ